MTSEDASTRILLNTFRTYQKSLDKLAEWLLNTAEQYLRDFELHEKPKGGSRLRVVGKIRKEASTPAEVALFALRLDSLPKLARFIKQSKEVIVPAEVLTWVEQALEIRKRFSTFHEKQAGRASKRVDGVRYLRHLCVIRILEKVLGILQRDVVSRDTTTQLGNIPGHGLSKKFDLQLTCPVQNLQLEESNVSDPNSFRNDRLVANNTPKLHRRVVYDADREADEEIILATFCLLEDHQDVRTYLQRTWWNYKLGKVDLMTASAVTNTAIDLVQRTEEDFGRTYYLFEDTGRITHEFFAYYCEVRGIDLEESWSVESWSTEEMAVVAQFCFVPTEFMLAVVSKTLEPGHLQKFKNGVLGLHDPQKHRQRFSYLEKLQEDEYIIREVLPEISLLARSKVQSFGRDWLTRGLRDMQRTKTPTLWLCFALQIFLDTYHIFREHIGRAFNELQAAGNTARELLCRIIAMSSQPKECLNDNLLRSTFDYAGLWIVDDTLDKMTRYHFGCASMAKSTEPFCLMRRHPLLCGLTKFTLIRKLHEVGIAVSTASGSISSVAHLYNALHQISMLSIEWPAIERFISFNTPGALFTGDVPETLEDCAKEYYLMVGKKKNAKKEQSGPRDWDHDPLTLETFSQQYFYNGCINWNVENIEPLLSKTNNMDTKQQATWKRWKTSHQISTLDLLSSLQNTMINQSAELKYDYLEMHYQCTALLHSLKTNLHGALAECLGPQYNSREDQVVGDILQVALGSQGTARSELAGDKKHLKRLMLAVVATTIKDFVRNILKAEQSKGTTSF